MHNMHDYARPLVVKYGGNAMDGSGALLAGVAARVRAGTPVVLVHGGGPEIDRWLSMRGVTTERIDGLRVTDATTLEVTEAVLCGTLNKRLVRACAALGLRAVGVSGEDGATLVATPARNRALAFVGEDLRCDPALLLELLRAGYVPIVAPLAVSADGTTALNVNADLAAAAIAGALKAQTFAAITNVTRVRRDPHDAGSGIDTMTLAQARAFADSPACDGGMKPKMQAAIAAVEAGCERALIGATLDDGTIIKDRHP